MRNVVSGCLAALLAALLASLQASLLAACASSAPSSAPLGEPTLREAAERAGMEIGFFIQSPCQKKGEDADADASTEHARNRADLERVAPEAFNIVTVGTYQSSNNPAPGRWDWSCMDERMDYAERHTMTAHGHPLVYGQSNVLPLWLKARADAGDWAGVRAAMESNIDALTARYRGRMKVWDVVNEAVDFDSDSQRWTYRPTPFHAAYTQNGEPGHTYLDAAFRRARAGAPDATLIYNDFANLEVNAKSDFIFETLSGMIARGVPVDGVGFQGHLGPTGRDTEWERGELDADSVRENFRRFRELGLEIFITEVDMYTSDTEPETLVFQGEMFGRVVELCRDEPACRTVQFWGFTDRRTWLDWFYDTGKTYPLLFDESTEPKPGYFAVRDALLTPQ